MGFRVTHRKQLVGQKSFDFKTDSSMSYCALYIAIILKSYI